MSEGSAPAIWTNGLTKFYYHVRAVDKLNLAVQPGEIFGLLGPNGAGKTTTILMLLGLSEPTAGRVRVVGLDPTRDALQVKRRVGYVPDNVGFYNHLTGRENLRYTAALNGLERATAEQRVATLLNEVGLEERADEPVRVYSRGMKQRLGIADALVKNPDVLILDEPTIGLDPIGADHVLNLVTRLATERGVATLLSSHLLAQVQAMCHRIGIFYRGRMVASGTVSELAAELGGGSTTIEIVVAEEDADLRSVLADAPGVSQVERKDNLWLVGVQEESRRELTSRLAAANLTIVHLQQRTEELGAIYRRYFSEGNGDGSTER